MPSDQTWDHVGCLIASTHRVAVCRALADRPGTPGDLGDRTDTTTSSASRAVRQLADAGLAELLVDEERHRGRLYALTDSGRAAYDRAVENDLIDPLCDRPTNP
ncbi:MarR family protein [Halogeometricum rufum]|uniref:MarR family protein n=1 Tax=Halogeometricum rufum TaxID=553469 RepID=A0A1I6GIE8_9EURY|nr:MarR family protein [Halogeometricum rufum]